ncbi:DUF4010 domain-containing protein [Cupriavidus sp. YR651]|uniref:DUF4010 domain-containing protein n=1 Tax=Cupriavidus sp. YR651 TaxID=1855315 RepID=UPI0015A35B04|nr:DUF4010 domain-containing protein [Cupriavidus sp. YR651]
MASAGLASVDRALGHAGVCDFLALALLKGLREPAQKTPASHASKLFDWRAAGIFATLVATLRLVGAVIEVWLGEAALIAISAGAELADAHAVATSVGALLATGRLEAGAAAMPVLAGLSTNAVAKIGAARAGGSPWFAGQVGIGLLAAMAAAWLTALGLPGIP